MSIFYHSCNHSAWFADLLIARIIARMMPYGCNSREIIIYTERIVDVVLID